MSPDIINLTPPNIAHRDLEEWKKKEQSNKEYDHLISFVADLFSILAPPPQTT